MTGSAGAGRRGQNYSFMPVVWCLMLLVVQQMMLEVAADIKLSVSYCNVCTTTGCTQSYYIHWGDNKLGSCKDSSAPLDNDYHTAYGNVNTPHGAGPYKLLNGNAGVDQVMSQITGHDGSIYTCYKANGAQFTNYCGLTYACSVGLSCYGPS